MAQYSNSQILSAIINKWAQPIIKQIAGSKIQNIGFIQSLEAKVKSTGWVNPNWSIVNEIAPLIEPISSKALTPVLTKYLSQVPEEALPGIAHSIVDKGLEDGSISLLDGKIIIELEDIKEMKNLLDWNLPLTIDAEYTLITEEPQQS